MNGSFAENQDLSTQLGYIVLLCDKYDKCSILHYSSHKSRRVVRSVLGGEVHAFADYMDFALVIKRDIEEMTGKILAVRIFTDSNSLFHVITKNNVTAVITKNTVTAEKRLMIDVCSVREAYERFHVGDVACVGKDGL